MDKSGFRRRFFEQALSEFKAATRPVTIADIQAFLALPYWKQRWQLYEVWFVTLLLRSYGLARLDLALQGDQWTLSVGGVMLTPIAISRLHNGDEIAFYYQYQGIPPQGLFPEAQDRPEVLVRYQAVSQQPPRTLLVAEVKARASFSRQDMEVALFALLKWRSEAIVGLNYLRYGQPSEPLGADDRQHPHRCRRCLYSTIASR